FGWVFGQVVQLTRWPTGSGIHVLRKAEAARAEAQLELPLSLPNPEHTLVRVMDHSFADRAGVCPEQRRQQIVTVFTGVIWKLRVSHSGHRGHQVGQASQFVADSARADVTRPTRKKRNAVASIPNVGFLAAPVSIGKV